MPSPFVLRVDFGRATVGRNPCGMAELAQDPAGNLKLFPKIRWFTLPTGKERFWPKGGQPLERVLLASSSDWIAGLIDLQRYVNGEVWRFRVGHTWSNDRVPTPMFWLVCDPNQAEPLPSAENWKPPVVFHQRIRMTFHNLWLKNQGLADTLRVYVTKVAAYSGSLSPTIVEKLWEEALKLCPAPTPAQLIS